MKKINIRKSVFESNSSSSHSISIDNTTKFMDISLVPNEEGALTLEGGEFGWTWDKFNDATTKANYASVEGSGVDRNVLIDVIKEQTGAKEVICLADGDHSSPNWSYIDHESVGNLLEVSSKDDLKNWIFNPNCWLITGNDNSDAPANLLDFPKTDEEGVQHPVKYLYKLQIKDFVTTAKFKSFPDFEEIKEAISNLTYNSKFYDNGEFKEEDRGWNSDEEIYEYNSWKLDRYTKDIVNTEEGFFYVFAEYKLREEADKLNRLEEKKLYEKSIITEKGIDKIEDKWTKIRRLEDKLIENKFDDFVKKIKFDIVEL